MRSRTATDSKIQKPSLTDAILKLCASGQFGVREAIAAATGQQKSPLSNAPAKPPKTQENKNAQHR